MGIEDSSTEGGLHVTGSRLAPPATTLTRTASDPTLLSHAEAAPFALFRDRLFSGNAPLVEPVIGSPGTTSMRRVHSYTPRRPLERKSAAIQAAEALAAPSPMLIDGDPIQHGRQYFTGLLKATHCYDMMPASGKIVVFDTLLHVKKAFFALVQHGLRSAMLWNSRRQQFVGMMTITDFINILRHSYRSPFVTMDELEQHRIQTWRELSEHNRPESLVSIDPSAQLFDAVRTLIGEKIHRLPVIDAKSGNALNIITHKRLLLLIVAMLPPNADVAIPMLALSIDALGLGTRRNIASITKETSLIVAMNIFVERRISALPIVDENGVVVDIYAKYDAIHLARERTYNNLDVTVDTALQHRPDFGGVQTCVLSDTLGQIMCKMAERRVHRLIIVDDHKTLVGILSLSDILSFLIASS